MAEDANDVTAEANMTVNVAEFIVDWTDRIGQVDPEPVDNDTFLGIVAKKLKIEPRMATELDQVCELSSLTCEGEPPGMYPGTSVSNSWKKIPPNVTNLSTLNIQRGEQKKRRADINYKITLSKSMKFRMTDGHWLHEMKHRRHCEEKLPVPRDAHVTVQLYEPFYSTAAKPISLAQEILVLGQQPLTAIRDTVACRLEALLPGDMSEHPDVKTDITSKEQFPSAFIFIEGVFYNDLRHPNARDYSLVIREWVDKDPERGLGPFETASMADTTVDSLNLQLGYPYVFVHQGNCEHLLVFSDIRLVHPADCLQVEEYPLAVKKFHPKMYKCRLCLKNESVYITYESPFAPEDPCVFCDTCFRMLHYDEIDQKIGNFRAYSCKTTL